MSESDEQTQAIPVGQSAGQPSGRISQSKKRDIPSYVPKRLTFANTPFDDTTKYHTRLFPMPAWRYLYVANLVVIDVVVMLFSLFICFVLNEGANVSVTHQMPMLAFLASMCITWVACLSFTGAYHRHVMAEGYALYTKLINATLYTIILSSCISFIFKLELPRTALIVAPILAGIIEFVARWLMRRDLHRNRCNGECKYPTVVIGSPTGINNALRMMKANVSLGYNPVAVCPISKDEKDANFYYPEEFEVAPDIEGFDKLKVLMFNSHFPRTIERMGVVEVYVADVLSRDSKMLHALSLAVESLGMELSISVELADMGGHRLHLRNTFDQLVLNASLPQYNGATAFIKRVIDIILSLIAIIISSPIMLGVVIAIKLDDGGPILFKQKRIGMHGKPFMMYKFRSMVTNAEEIKAKLAEQYGQTDRFIFKLKDDPRITKVGKFIRKTSLDEFPQFFNVLKGDMSMVGPRPALPEEVARYNSLYSTRLLVKPGITGPWQVSGRSDLSQEQSEFLDVSYIENWSLTGDFAILVKTVAVVLRGTGSY